MGVTYDAGALVAGDCNSRQMWALHRRSLERQLRPVVPAGVLAQGWRGGPQAELSRLLAGCRIEEFDEARARSAGTACARAGTADVVDAAVVVGATARGDVVVSTDRGDLQHLAEAIGVTVTVQSI